MTAKLDNAVQRVLVVYDGKRGPSATQKISFAQPFENASGSTSVMFEVVDAPPLEIANRLIAHVPDILVLSRCTSEVGSEWVAHGRRLGMPIIFHIDDDLLAVPASLGAAKHSTYNSRERLDALRRNIESSDLVYASTAALGERLREHGIRTPLIAGSVYCSVAPQTIGAVLAPATGPVIGYMGTSGHAADLAMIMPAVCEALDAIPQLQFELFGTIGMPEEMKRFGSRVRHLPPVPDYSDFIPRLRTLGWWIGLAPLEDNPFNRCKADTKWVEYSLAGMAVIASNLPVYHSACREGAGLLADPPQWKEALLTLLYRPHLRAEMIRSAQARLQDSYTHEHLRRQVERVFEEAFARSSSRIAARSMEQAL